MCFVRHYLKFCGKKTVLNQFLPDAQAVFKKFCHSLATLILMNGQIPCKY